MVEQKLFQTKKNVSKILDSCSTSMSLKICSKKTNDRSSRIKRLSHTKIYIYYTARVTEPTIPFPSGSPVQHGLRNQERP